MFDLLEYWKQSDIGNQIYICEHTQKYFTDIKTSRHTSGVLSALLCGMRAVSSVQAGQHAEMTSTSNDKADSGRIFIIVGILRISYFTSISLHHSSSSLQ